MPTDDAAVIEAPTGTLAEVFTDDGDQSQQQQDDGQQQQQQDDGKAAGSLTPEAIRESVRAGMADARKEGQPPKEYSAKELDEMFKVWTPKADLVKAIREGDEAAALNAIVEMRNGLLSQFDTLAQKRLELLERKLTEQMNPALGYAQEAAAAKDREAFFAEHEDLKDHEALVQTVFYALKAEGFQAKDVKDAFQTLADRTRALLPKTNGQVSGTGQPSGARQQTTTQTTRKPAVLSGGGGAGGGDRSSAPVAPFPGGEVFM